MCQLNEKPVKGDSMGNELGSEALEMNHTEGRAIWDGMRVAVTGGTSGLGLALVRMLLDRGAKVAFVARSREGVERLMRERPEARGITGDVSKKDDIYPIAIQILGALGGLDVLINNASALGPVPLVPLADTNCEDFELALETNVLGPFRLTKALLGALAASTRDGGHPLVLNISSDAAVNAYPNWGAYGASKAALHHLSRIWNEELASQGIRVISSDPGDMYTPLHALAVPDSNRSALKRPEDAAQELISKIANLISGRQISAAGTVQEVSR
jgi:NAD(P)-dependent dehydrogenase (short-subunit alcohol dehydrogenase family)